MELNNYLYYVIRDNEQNIRCNIIGTQHNVDQKDTKLNPTIIEAINRSSRAILEMPPASKLIPSSDPQWIPNPERVIDREFKKIIPQPSNPKTVGAIEDEIRVLLRDVKEQTLPENYEKVVAVIEKIKSSEDKLSFVQAIAANMSEFNEVSLEENINKIIKSNQKCEILSLEDIDLAKLLEVARSKVPEEQVDEETQILRQSLQKELYSAWIKGDAEELKKRLDECFLLYPEAPEFEEIHAPRNENIAKRIVDIILQTKEEDKEIPVVREDLVVMGYAHLLYSKRKNVIKYLNERFESDLSGWSITQVKIV